MFGTYLSPFFFMSILLAVLPGIFWFAIFLWEDREDPEPRGLLFRLVLGGAIAALLAVVVEDGIRGLLGRGGLGWGNADLMIAAVVEKALLLAVVLLVAWRHRAFNQMIDGVVYAVSAALGFAMVENFLFLTQWVPANVSGGAADFARMLGTVSLLRFLLTTSLHVFSVGVCGYVLGMARFSTRSRVLMIAGGLLLAVLMHAAFDIALLRGYVFPMIASVALFGASFLILIRRRAALEMRSAV